MSFYVHLARVPSLRYLRLISNGLPVLFVSVEQVEP